MSSAQHHLGRVTLFCMTLLVASLVAYQAPAQTVWRAELPAGVPEREATVLQQFSQRLSLQTGAVQVAAPHVESRNQRDVLNRVVSDQVQVSLIPVASMFDHTTDFQVFDSIFVFRNLGAVDTYTNSLEGARLLSKLREQGLQGLGFVHGGMTQVASRRPIDVSRDLRGLKIGTPPQTERSAQQLAMLGLHPVSLAAAESSSALIGGAVDAIEVTWPTLAQSLREDLNWSVLESNHSYRGYVLVVSRNAFDDLSVLAQNKVVAEAKSVITSHNGRVIAEEQSAREAALARVNTVIKFTRSDYDKVFAKLATPPNGAWNAALEQRYTMAAALAVSDPALARKYFGTAPALEPTFEVIYKAAATPLPVYNIGLSPRSATEEGIPVLLAGARVVLSFDIGPRKDSSVIDSRSPPSEILRGSGDIGLTAILFCSFCEPTDDEVLQQLIFRPAQGRSEEVRFNLIPKTRADGSSYDGILQLTVINDNTGRPFDRINIDVFIEGVVNARHANTSSILALNASGAVDDSKWQPDVVLHAIANNAHVTLAVQPVSKAMTELIGTLALDSRGKRRVFRTGIDSVEAVKAMTTSAYGAMSALSKQGDFLKRLSAEGINGAVSDDAQQLLKLTDDESRRVAEVFANVGMTFYRDLIASSADADLERLIKLLEQSGEQAANDGRPLRVHVQSNLSLPWQYLHPNGTYIDPNKFWGLRFSLSVERSSDGASLPSTFPINSKARKVSFARYTPSDDASVSYAMKQIDQLRQLPIADADLIRSESGDEFKKTLKQQRKELRAIITFLHASSGDVETAPYLQFDNGDHVSATTLDTLRNELSGAELRSERYLSGAPIVILNACETGSSRPLPYVSFQNVLAKMGARGVVTTEVSIWMTLGHEVGTNLIARLGRGEAIAEALTAIRRDLYAKKKNPLGLLYAYYGDPAATLLKSTLEVRP
jgi:TRAP-type C4-dicarboxylate transport system substrate-binding protein